MKVENGMSVEVHYTGKHENGDVFDSSETRGETLNVNVGEGQVIPGFDEALVGMTEGDKKTVTIAPDKGYGEVIKEAIQEMPTSQLPEGVKAGDSLQGMGPQGPVMCTVESVNGDTATVDFNHPLAGKTITFDIELVKINE
jgi:FKBP-type peptidyl-prolyl cis-trans isomerase 2